MNRHNFPYSSQVIVLLMFVICLVVLAKTQQIIQEWRKWETYHFHCPGFRESVPNEITIGGIYCPTLIVYHNINNCQSKIHPKIFRT